MAAVVLIALAIIAQAGVLVGIYLLSRRLTDNVNSLMSDSRRLMEPLEGITNNLKLTSEDLVQSGKIVREQVHHIEEAIDQTRETILAEIAGLRNRVYESFEDARETVMQPVRQWSAIAKGIAEGV